VCSKSPSGTGRTAVNPWPIDSTSFPTSSANAGLTIEKTNPPTVKYVQFSRRPKPVDFDQLASYVPKVNAALRESYRQERRAVAPEFRPYVDLLSDFTLRGGKRFRALLVLAGYHIASNRDPVAALPAAVALEHFQSWMLIHDDIIDHAATRRGGPALHRRLTDQFESGGRSGDAESFGVGMGITLGDLQEPFTLRELLRVRASSAVHLAAVEEFARMSRATAYGQILDIDNAVRPVDKVTERMVLTVHRLKSAVYTVVAPLRIGAALGAGKPALLDDLETVATDLGVAFQLRDDVLGAGFGREGPGKSANDLVEGKRTLLVVRAWARGSSEDRSTLGNVLGNPVAAEDQVEAAREVIRRTGSLEYSEKRIRALHHSALRQLGRSRRIRADSKQLLAEVGERLVNRSV
jgi:geranylgeranyl diphosphate synthase type I